jgi:hypothetical protein
MHSVSNASAEMMNGTVSNSSYAFLAERRGITIYDTSEVTRTNISNSDYTSGGGAVQSY